MKQYTVVSGRAFRCLLIVLMICCARGQEITPGQPVLHLKNRSWTTANDLQAFSGTVAKSRTGQAGHYIIQFDQFPSQEQLWTLEDRGVTILGYVPENAMVVSASGQIALEGLNAHWRGRLESQDKISHLLTTEVPEAGPSSDSAVESFLIEFQIDTSNADMYALAAEYGLETVENSNLLHNHLLVRGVRSQVMRLTEWDEVTYIFPVNEDLIAGTEVTTCAGALTKFGTLGQFVAKAGEGWDGPGRGRATIHFVFSQLTSKIGGEAQKAEIVRAMKEWERVAGIQFSLSTNAAETKTVNILFAEGDHGDGNPFDGRSGVLAHTFYPIPLNAEPIAGDMHFDNAENWQIGADVDLYSVALHELGHALGLGHSDKPGAVMYPYYRRATLLTVEDANAILQIYADPQAPTPAPTPAPAPNPIPTSPLPVVPLSVSVDLAPSETQESSISFSGSLSGGTGPWTMIWLTDQGVTGRAGIQSVGGTARWNASAVPVIPGSNSIIFTALDFVSNRAMVSVDITRKQVVPTVPTLPTVPTTPVPVPTVPNPQPTLPVMLAIANPSSANYRALQPKIDISGTASHSSGIARVEWVSSQGRQGVATTGSAGSWAALQIPLDPGSAKITVKATANNGNSATSAIDVSYVGPSTGTGPAPSLTITSPASSSSQASQPTVIMKGNALSGVGITEVTWGTSSGRSGSCEGSTTWICYDVPMLVGSNTVTIRVKDNAGVTNWKAVTITRR